MEVSVFDTTGLPEGCLLSIRAGSTRRQAPIPLAEPLRFPNLPFNAKQFKIDVMSTLGSARLDINAVKESESYSVPLELEGGTTAKVGITIREDPSLCGKRSFELKQVDKNLRTEPTAANAESPRPATTQSTPQSPEKAKATRDTREYAKDHNIPNLVQEMLQYVLRERPDAPYSVMAAYLARKAQERGEKFDSMPAFPETSTKKSPASVPSQKDVVPSASVAASAPSAQAPTTEKERLQLESEHLALRAERAAWLRELSEIPAATP